MEAEKNIFGQYKQYKSPVLSDSDKVVINAVINQIADSIQSQLSDDEFIAETSNESATILYLIAVVNKNLPEGITKVDGKTLSPLLRTILSERYAIIHEANTDGE